jgi:hypothetical protein
MQGFSRLVATAVADVAAGRRVLDGRGVRLVGGSACEEGPDRRTGRASALSFGRARGFGRQVGRQRKP